MNDNNTFRKLSVIGASVLAVLSLAPTARAGAISGDLTTDNAFFAYISTSDSSLGTLVASGNNWPQTFTFSNFTLTPGITNYLHIEAINYGGPGGFIGEFTLDDTDFQFANGSQTLLTNTTDWSGIYNDSNGDPNTQQAWVQPTAGIADIGPNGVSPWGTVSDVSGAADWIWANDANSFPGGSVCGTCTIDLSTPIISTAVLGAPEPGTFTLLGGALAALPLIRRLRRSRAAHH